MTFPATAGPNRDKPPHVPSVLLLNKPYGVLCQFTGDGTRRTLRDYVNVPGVYPAGRLDADSEGLVVLTADGALQARIADPRHKLRKTYWAEVEGVPTAAQLAGTRTWRLAARRPDAPGAGTRNSRASACGRAIRPIRVRRVHSDRLAGDHAGRGPEPAGPAHDGRRGTAHAAPHPLVGGHLDDHGMAPGESRWAGVL